MCIKILFCKVYKVYIVRDLKKKLKITIPNYASITQLVETKQQQNYIKETHIIIFFKICLEWFMCSTSDNTKLNDVIDDFH